jgi:hypothetical protein
MPCECPEAQAENMGHLWVRFVCGVQNGEFTLVVAR